MKKIDIIRVRYNDVKIENSDGPKLRGFFGRKFMRVDYFHNHSKEGILYRYPLVQYKVLEGTPVVVLLSKGCEIASRYNAVDKIIIDENEFISENIEVSIKKENFGVIDNRIKYRFITPWIGLNQKNIIQYSKTSSLEERKYILEKVINGNLLSLSKGMNYRVEERIESNIDISTIDEKKVYFKGKKLIGHTFEFDVNFDIPEFIGIGKACSRGFGSVEKCK